MNYGNRGVRYGASLRCRFRFKAILIQAREYWYQDPKPTWWKGGDAAIADAQSSPSTASTDETPWKRSRANAVELSDYIQRGATDVLKTLSSAVSQDPTGYSYIFHDDPFMLPGTIFQRRQFAQAKEAGRRVGKELATEWPTLFMLEYDDPRIDAYRPRRKPDDSSTCDLNSLIDRINRRLVINAMTIYSNMINMNVPVPTSVRADLLELLCFFNSNDSDLRDSDNPIERSIRDYLASDQRGIIVDAEPFWVENCAADQLFNSIDNKGGRIYSAMICGLAKHNRFDRAMQIKQDLKGTDIKLMLEAYNALLTYAYTESRRSIEIDKCGERLSFCKAIMAEMSAQGVYPDVITFNSALYTAPFSYPITRENRDKVAAQFVQFRLFARHCLAEMNSLHIDKSLATIAAVIAIECIASPDDSLPVANQLIDEVKLNLQKYGRIVDTRDTYACTRIVSHIKQCASRSRQDRRHWLRIAYDLRDIFEHPSNRCTSSSLLITDQFYTILASLVVRCENMNRMMEEYWSLVPYKCSPSLSITTDLLNAISISGRVEYLPRAFSDAVHSNWICNAEIFDKFVEVILAAIAPPPHQKGAEPLADDKMVKREDLIAKIGTFPLRLEPLLVETRRLQPKSRTIRNLDALLYSRLAYIALQLGNISEAWRLFNCVLKLKRDFEPPPSTPANPHPKPPPSLVIAATPEPAEHIIKAMLDCALERGHIRRALVALEIFARCRYLGLREQANRITESKTFVLNARQKVILNRYVKASAEDSPAAEVKRIEQ